LITESTDLTIEDETLKIDVGAAEAGKTWGLVASTGLETDYHGVSHTVELYGREITY
jgi:hypothetical protein